MNRNFLFPGRVLKKGSDQVGVCFCVRWIPWGDKKFEILYTHPLKISTKELRNVTIGLTTFQIEFGAQWNLLLAGAVVSILPLFIVYILAQDYIVEGTATTGLR